MRFWLITELLARLTVMSSAATEIGRPPERAVADDGAVARGRRPVDELLGRGERADLVEAVGVEERGDALARRHLAVGPQGGDALGAAHVRADGVPPLEERLDRSRRGPTP